MRFLSWLMRGVVRRRSLRRSEEWRSAAAARTAPRGARDPVQPGFAPGGGQAAAQIRCHCRSCRRGSPAENRHGGAPRGVPVAPGHGGRASHARRKRRVRLSALHPPLVRGAMGLLLPGLPPRLRRPLHRSLGQGRGEQDRRTRAHKRAAGTKKTALFCEFETWPTVRFARRDFARRARDTRFGLCADRRLTSSALVSRVRAKRSTPGHELTAQSRAPASPCRTSARHGRSNGSPRNRRRHRRDSRTR